MGTFVIALLFLGVAGVAFAVANRFVKRWLPASQPASQATMVVISMVLVFASVFFFTAWGLNPAVIQINLQQSLNPLRWVNWVLSALNFGVAQAFILALFRSRVETARRLGALPPPTAVTERALADGPESEPAVEAGAAAKQPLEEDPAHARAVAGDARSGGEKAESSFGFARAPFSGFGLNHHELPATGRGPEFTRGERVAVIVLAVWVVVHFIVLGWVRTL